MHDEPVAIATTIAGPFGPIHLAATSDGIVAVEWLTAADAFRSDLSRRLRGSVVPGPGDVGAEPDVARAHLAAGVAAVLRLLALDPTPPTVPLDLADRPAWDQRVLGEVARIPFGRTASYGEVARRVGAPRAARAVGGALGRNPITLLIPCHRVIAGDGSLGGYGGGTLGDPAERLAIKRGLLAREGVTTVARAR